MQIAQIVCWFIWTPVGVPFCQDIKFCGMGMDMYCQREVLREATMYPTIAMVLHFLVTILKKIIVQSCNHDIIHMGLQIHRKSLPLNYQKQKIRANSSIFTMLS